MMEALLQGSIPAPQAQALANILAVTRREWQIAELGPIATKNDHPGRGHNVANKGQTPGQSKPRSRQRRRDQFAQRAARAFEAQVMALRCRQAFVA